MSSARVLVFKILFLVLIAHLQLASASSSTEWPPDRGAEVGEEEAEVQSSSAKRRGGSAASSSQDAASGVDSLAPEMSAVASPSAESIQGMTTPTSTTAQVNYAELCYLSNGGSSLTLTVNEATQVGAIVGTVDVNGDPSLESGNVDLFEAPEFGGSGAVSSSSSSSSVMSALTRQSSSQSMLDSPALEGSRRRVLGRRSLLASSRSPQIMGVSSEHSASQFYSLLAASAHQATTQPPAATTTTTTTTTTTQTTNQSPVRLEPGTKNLILVRQLDKEAPEAELSLVVNVRCITRASRAAQTSDPQAFNNPTVTNSESSTNIPIRILITDANDHAPEFLGQKPYVLNISETTPVGTVITRDIIAQDKDSAGPFSTIHYRVLEDGSAQSGLLQFVAPLEPALVLMAPLDYESFSSFTLTVLAQDQGEPEPLSSSIQVQVNVMDFDDQNPRFLDDKYTLIMDENQQSLVGQNLQVLPRNLYAEDGDRGINALIFYSFDQLGGFQQQQDQELLLLQQQAGTKSASSDSDESLSLELDSADPTLSIERYLHLNPSTGEIRLIRQWPTSGNLAASVPLTLVIRATQADNRDRYALTTLTITRPTLPIQQPNVQLKSRNETAQKSQQREGIEFSPARLNVSVPEGVSVNEKIARVHARFLGTANGRLLDESSEPVDIRTEATPANMIAKRTGGATRKYLNENSPSKKPINYQLLDDQTDQFGINGLGEIFVKRTLDYELRQEYKFRVLATYAKHSDICQVQVTVLNLNDNKPKFSQAQYTFHLTESRLRANSFGSVQAHDADLNDAIQYSLLGENAHLFEVSHLGQLSLRSTNRQLNSSSYQLIIQASDSLAPPIHTHQARLLIQVAPQLVGRALDSLSAGSGEYQAGSNVQESRLFNSRSLLQQKPLHGESWPRSAPTARDSPSVQTPAQQQQARSSFATVVSSLQHMVRGLNLLDMPTASALLLAALLAFLICLLFIVLISMSVHLYRRRSKLRHRHQLAAAARLRHAQLAAINQPDSSAFTSANNSPPDSLPSDNTLSPNVTQHPPNQLAHNSTPARMQHLNCAYMKTGAGQMSAAGYKQQQVSLKPGALHLQLKVATQRNNTDSSVANGQAADSSLASTCSDRSKRSYKSSNGTTSDDSSVMHCGHYSINSCRSPESHPNGSSNNNNNLLTQAQAQITREDTSGFNNKRKLIVPSVKSLVGQQKMHTHKAELSAMTSGEPGVRAYRKLPHLGSLVRPSRLNRIVPIDETVDSTTGQSEAKKFQTNELDPMQIDSAIASDVSSSSGSRVPVMNEPNCDKNHAQSRSDMNELEKETLYTPELDMNSAIKWPRESVPQRVKKLTWDDELSCQRSASGAATANDEIINDDDECFLSPDIQLAGPIIGSPLSNHQYPIEGTTNNEDHYAEQHFLFSTPCSPALLSSAEFNSQHFAPTSGGKDNCFDYTIVQSTHFSLDSMTNNNQHHQPSLSAQHHLLQQQQQRAPIGYLYSNNNNGQSTVTNNNNQDLRLMNSVVL